MDPPFRPVAGISCVPVVAVGPISGTIIYKLLLVVALVVVVLAKLVGTAEEGIFLLASSLAGWVVDCGEKDGFFSVKWFRR